MKELLDGQFAPITHSWGFLEASLEVAGKASLDWQETIYPTSPPKRERLSGNLCELLQCLNPLAAPPTMVLWMSTAEPNWTAYFDNFINGSDPFPPVSYLSEKLGCRGLEVSCVPNTLVGCYNKQKGRYGSVSFALFGPKPTKFLNYERSISAANDGVWEAIAHCL